MIHRIIYLGAIGGLMAGSLLLMPAGAYAGQDEALPAAAVTAAIEAAVAAYPGQVKGVDVGHADGRLVVEVEVVGADGAERQVAVDAESGEVRK